MTKNSWLISKLKSKSKFNRNEKIVSSIIMIFCVILCHFSSILIMFCIIFCHFSSIIVIVLYKLKQKSSEIIIFMLVCNIQMKNHFYLRCENNDDIAIENIIEIWYFKNFRERWFHSLLINVELICAIINCIAFN